MGRIHHKLLMGLGALAALAAPAAADPAPRPFTCCDTDWATTAVGEYVDVHDALVRGDPRNQVGWHIQQLVRALDNPAGIDDSEATMMTEQAALARSLERAPLEKIRAGFASLSRAMVVLALRHEGGRRTVVEAWCPGTGPWLQEETDSPHSPYGEKCGRWR